MSELLENYAGGRWVAGEGQGIALTDPITGAEVARVSNVGLDMKAAFAYARETGGPALRAMSYAKRATALAATAKLLQSNRDAYYEIATANSGTTKNDSAIDIEGAIYTANYFARAGSILAEGKFLTDGARVSLAKDESFQTQHIMLPMQGVALFINAFNFPAWGLWEKAAPALLSGVPVIVKPATATAWLTQRMVADVVKSGLWPQGALSVICGSSKGLMDALTGFDMVSFTGSAETASIVRSHPAVSLHSVRANIEADSLNSALLLPDAKADSEGFNLLVREVVRELTQKSGQKCTCIRRVFVPEAVFDAAVEAIGAKLTGITVGNPRNETVRMGSLVNREQYNAVRDGLEKLKSETQVAHDGDSHVLIDADPKVAACIGPFLLATRNPDDAKHVHDTEVFGPAATIMPYRDLGHAAQLIGRGQGSLVASLYSDGDARMAAQACRRIAPFNGRVHVVSPDVAKTQTSHGNVMPQSIHGGPGRAGGGEELGGLRALGFYHRRTAIQANPATLDELTAAASPWSV
jgi:3,4-dehydroadipyl-CoA semialdehyde dehydrogenase